MLENEAREEDMKNVNDARKRTKLEDRKQTMKEDAEKRMH